MTIEAGTRYDAALCLRLPSQARDELARVAAERGMKPTEMLRAAVIALVRDPNAFPDIGLPVREKSAA
ncbi:hypothetical protein DBB29_08730 [Pandoraea cepalis]|uniref:CopG family transcriptional regulator n=1 Tax=Pandoraea cepalis TaxID=2508294 RepID=A0AAW7MLJ5_9BURK|nr:hypothetical protein [Pandoraea cepalis]MDN4573658.1 hypothetical protein [Pandoraea cepalis]MDN4578200.1 hypothetical protein [Pandoraea cepalis]